MPSKIAVESHDVVVIGAGISGASTALDLARQGVDVLLLDRFAPAAMASGWTLAGVRQSGRQSGRASAGEESGGDLADAFRGS